MLHLHLFSDGSVNPKSKIGYGAYLLLLENHGSLAAAKSKIKTKRFEQTSSTKLELQTLLWSLQATLEQHRNVNLTVYTDCQNIIRLPDRQVRLEKNQYVSSKNRRLDNEQLYREFYQLMSKVHCTFVKVVAHQGSKDKSNKDHLFALVDKAARAALRENS